MSTFTYVSVHYLTTLARTDLAGEKRSVVEHCTRWFCYFLLITWPNNSSCLFPVLCLIFILSLTVLRMSSLLFFTVHEDLSTISINTSCDECLDNREQKRKVRCAKQMRLHITDRDS